jgi:photosystem II stability/assembly factor-like uncharacterized protein
VSCPTTSECVAVGQGVSSGTLGLVEVSSDGGQTFTDEPVPMGTPQLKAVTCFDAMHCIAVGGSTALVTTNGGSTWNTEFAGWNLTAVGCVNGTSRTASGYTPIGTTVVTSDGGLTWQQSTGNQPPLINLTCTSATCVGIVAQEPYAAVSGNAGATWQRVGFMDDGFKEPLSVACLASTTSCIMVGQDTKGISDPTLPAAAFITSDDGQSWADVSSALPSGSWSMMRVSCPTSNTCYAVGNQVGATSVDGGAVWASVTGPSGPLPPDGKETIAGSQTLSCASTSTCVVVGYDSLGPAAAYTINSATSWSQATSIG